MTPKQEEREMEDCMKIKACGDCGCFHDPMYSPCFGDETPVASKAEDDQTQNTLPCIPLPEGLDFRNGGTQCDMLNGPCACGAWHHIEDLTWRIFNQLKAEKNPVSEPEPSDTQRESAISLFATELAMQDKSATDSNYNGLWSWYRGRICKFLKSIQPSQQ